MDPLSLGVSVIAVGISGGALAVALRGERRAEREATASPELSLGLRAVNVGREDDGALRVSGTAGSLQLAITIENTGTKAAGRTPVLFWMPEHLSSLLVKWLDSSGVEINELGRSAPDSDVQLDTGDGRSFNTQRLDRTIDSVPRHGETLYVRVPFTTPPIGGVDGFIPVRAEVTTDGSQADELEIFQLRNTDEYEVLA